MARKRPGSLVCRSLAAQGGRLSPWRKKNDKKEKKIPGCKLLFAFFCRQKVSYGRDGRQGLGEKGERQRNRGFGNEGNTAKNRCLQAAGRDKSRPEDDTSFSVISWQVVKGPKAASPRPGGVSLCFPKLQQCSPQASRALFVPSPQGPSLLQT